MESTRSTKSVDSHRDMDGFDVDEELRRFRVAKDQGDWELAVRLASNIDEYLRRGGPWPVEWLGPHCMRNWTDQDFRVHHAMERSRY